MNFERQSTSSLRILYLVFDISLPDLPAEVSRRGPSADESQSSASFFFFSSITKALLLGAGITEFSPFTYFHITSFSSRSGTLSSLARLNNSDRLLLRFTATFRF